MSCPPPPPNLAAQGAHQHRGAHTDIYTEDSPRAMRRFVVIALELSSP